MIGGLLSRRAILKDLLQNSRFGHWSWTKDGVENCYKAWFVKLHTMTNNRGFNRTLTWVDSIVRSVVGQRLSTHPTEVGVGKAK